MIAGKRYLVPLFALAFALANFMPGAFAATSHHSSGALKLKTTGYLTVGSDATYPPQESYDPSTHKYLGTDIDLANALAKAMGLKGAKIVNNTFSTIILSLQKGNFDVIMSSMNDTPDRRKQIAFVDYMKASEGLLVRKGSGIHANNYNGMCGKTIAVEDGTTESFGMEAANAHACKHNKINIKKYAQDTAAFAAFQTHKADAYSGDWPVVKQYYQQYHNLVAAGKAFASGQDYGIGLLKKDKALKTALVKALNKIRANGQYKAILKRWGVGFAAL